jgi:hypothetical protein
LNQNEEGVECTSWPTSDDVPEKGIKENISSFWSHLPTARFFTRGAVVPPKRKTIAKKEARFEMLLMQPFD